MTPCTCQVSIVAVNRTVIRTLRGTKYTTQQANTTTIIYQASGPTDNGQSLLANCKSNLPALLASPGSAAASNATAASNTTAGGTATPARNATAGSNSRAGRNATTVTNGAAARNTTAVSGTSYWEVWPATVVTVIGDGDTASAGGTGSNAGSNISAASNATDAAAAPAGPGSLRKLAQAAAEASPAPANATEGRGSLSPSAGGPGASVGSDTGSGLGALIPGGRADGGGQDDIDAAQRRDRWMPGRLIKVTNASCT
uniref:Uncharacterized protein n=1 Tax=Tetradesmus obliquus TaxID=3088 RepID=A0A383WIF4_TETOB|eukprot:jgi/Sobl393_1/1293/SZX77201.1